MKGTFNIVTRALERAPYWQKVIRESGWELSCAGARWLDFMHVKPEEEDKQLREAIQSLVDVRGGDKAAPMGKSDIQAEGCKEDRNCTDVAGFCVGRKSNYSQRLYAQACEDLKVPMLYSADSFADEIPVSPLPSVPCLWYPPCPSFPVP